MTLQASLDHESSDAQRFLELIQIAVSSGKAHIESSLGGNPENSSALGWREAGLLSRCDKGRNTTKLSILGIRPNVYALKITDVFDLDSQTNVSIGFDPSEMPF